MRSIVLLSFIAACLPARAAEPEPRVLRKAAEIAAEVTLPDATPARVVFEGRVAYQDPGRSTFFTDDTGVTFIFGGTNPVMQPGDVVRITGVAHQGVIIGGIKPETIEVIGRGEPPPATPIDPADLATGRYHYHRVALEGVIRRVAPAGDAALALMLYADGKPARIEAEAPASEAAAAAVRLVDARVRTTGLVVGNINDRRQVVEPFIRVKRFADVEVLEPPPADPFEIPVTPLAALASRAINDHRVLVQGTAVAGPIAGAVYLRDGDRSLCVTLADPASAGVRAGDRVQAVGFPQMGIFSVELADAVLRVTGSGPPRRARSCGPSACAASPPSRATPIGPSPGPTRSCSSRPTHSRSSARRRHRIS